MYCPHMLLILLVVVFVGVALVASKTVANRGPTWILVVVAIALAFATWSIAGDVQT